MAAAVFILFVAFVLSAMVLMEPTTARARWTSLFMTVIAVGAATWITLTGRIDPSILFLMAWPALLASMATLRHWVWPSTPRHVPGTCWTCGYNLTGNVSGRCPECGMDITQPPPVAETWQYGPQCRQWVLLALAVILSLWVALNVFGGLRTGIPVQPLARSLMLPAIVAILFWLAYVDQRRR